MSEVARSTKAGKRKPGSSNKKERERERAQGLQASKIIIKWGEGKMMERGENLTE